jgi:ketosteroid isomerase-like protein
MTGTTAKHPNVEMWEKVYETFTTGDTDRLAQLIAPDVVWHVPGDNLISGTYTTREAIFGCFNKIHELSEGTYKPQLLDILADGNRGDPARSGSPRRQDARPRLRVYLEDPRRADRRAVGSVDRRSGMERILVLAPAASPIRVRRNPIALQLLRQEIGPPKLRQRQQPSLG